MDFGTVIGIALWIWGAFRGWKIVSGWSWEWINKKEPLNYVVKGAFCVAFGFLFVVIQIVKFVMKMFSIIL